MGPATMGSPSVFGSYANGASTTAHTSVVPVADFLEQRLRDVGSTWPGLLAVMPTPLNGLDTFGEAMATTPKRKYGGMDSVAFLQDLAACEDDEAFEISPHAKAREILEGHHILTAKRLWEKQFDNAAVLRKGFEEHVCPNLKPPNCRVNVIYADGIETPSKMKFDKNLYHKAQIIARERGDDTITAKSVERMCEAWKNAGVPHLFRHNAGKVHHKELISCSFTMKLMGVIMNNAEEASTDTAESSEDACCAAE